MLAVSGHPILTDYGQMRLVEGCVDKDWWMSDLYRAPEVLMHLPWGYPVDIWSIGVMTLELLEGKNLFDLVDRVHGQYVLPLALAQYIGYLGPPPLNIIQKSPLFSTYFDAQGNWISEPPIPKISLEDFVTTIPPGEEKDQFFTFYTEDFDLGPGSESHGERNYTRRMAYEAALRGCYRETLGCIR